MRYSETVECGLSVAEIAASGWRAYIHALPEEKRTPETIESVPREWLDFVCGADEWFEDQVGRGWWDITDHCWKTFPELDRVALHAALKQVWFLYNVEEPYDRGPGLAASESLWQEWGIKKREDLYDRNERSPEAQSGGDRSKRGPDRALVRGRRSKSNAKSGNRKRS